MIVNVEFLDAEPIENVITSLNFQVDKTLFFGYEEVVEKYGEHSREFLKKYCGVGQVLLYVLPRNNLKRILKILKFRLLEEIRQGNQLFFDITGGDSLVLVAFGMLSREIAAPMHMFDVEKGKLIELDTETEGRISQTAPARKVALNLDSFIELQGGVINNRAQKKLKNPHGPEAEEIIRKMWNIASRHQRCWNSFSRFMRSGSPDESMTVRKKTSAVNEFLHAVRGLTSTKLNEILDDCQDAGILTDVVHNKEQYAYTYLNDAVRECFGDAGSILELHTYVELKEDSTDCRAGVHLDWDGVIHDKSGVDVLNEIDVLLLQEYIPTFVSCKSGTADKSALYELETVARRFGGKYAKKVLVAPQGMSETDLIRAQEMGIEVRKQ